MCAEPATASWLTEYLEVREREGRLYPDAIVRDLPNVPAGHPLEREWRQRAASAERLIAHLGLRSAARVIDVGSGNGWLSNRIATLPGSVVVGLEANDLELRQARRVFGDDQTNLRFVEGDAVTAESPLDRPDAIVLASVIQYFADLPAVIERLLGWLEPDGELHILDSPLYRPGQVAGARDRSRRHYEALGAPQMAEAYHHHLWSSLDGFKTQVMYRPTALEPRLARRVLRRPTSPFPWIRVRP